MSGIKAFIGGLLAAMFGLAAWLLGRRYWVHDGSSAAADVADAARKLRAAEERRAKIEAEAKEELAAKLDKHDREVEHAFSIYGGSLSSYLRELNRGKRGSSQGSNDPS